MEHLNVVCSACKRVKTDTGEWIHIHLPRGCLLTHGCCPRCVVELYPDMAEEILTNVAKRAAARQLNRSPQTMIRPREG